MIASFALWAFALALMTGAPRLLDRVELFTVSPRIGILVWQLTSLSAVLSFVAAAATACWLLDSEFSAAMPIVGSAGLVLAGGAVLRVAWCAGQTSVRLSRERGQHRAGLALVARTDESVPGALVIDRADVAAYCLPDRGCGEVVVTTGALGALSPAELEAVLAHERAHLDGRHDLVVSCALVLREAFPFVALFRQAAEALPRMVEMAADDGAVRRAGRRALASAVLRMAEAATPAVALGVGGHGAVDRVHRLVRPGSSGPAGRAFALASGVGLALAPVALCSVAIATGCRLVFLF